VNVSLSPEIEAWLREKVASGRYHSVDEAIVEAVRLLEMQDEMDTVRLKLLREEIGAGIDQLDKGLGLDGERFLQDLRDSRK
jgi:antitoxin ParD1/3/4